MHKMLILKCEKVRNLDLKVRQSANFCSENAIKAKSKVRNSRNESAKFGLP